MSKYFWRITAGLVTLLFTSAAGANELAERQMIQSTVQKLFAYRDYAGLERMAEELRRDRTRTPSGVWKLTFFYRALPNHANVTARNEAYIELIHSGIEKWIETYPQSPTPRIYRAQALVVHGWMYRGTGAARTVPPEMWQLFESKITQASDYLQRYKHIASVDPHWYTIMGDVAIAQRWPLEKLLALIQEGTTREPYYYQSYFAAANYLLPQWYGDTAKVDAFARSAVARTKEQDGMGMYARIYWSFTDAFEDVVQELRVDWKTMKTAMRDVLERYPDAWNIRNFAVFACKARDRAEAIRLLSMLKDHEIAVGDPPQGFSACVGWATSP
jgi:hypothetical protein